MTTHAAASPPEQAEAAADSEGSGQGLIEALPARPEEEQRPGRVSRFDGCEDRLGPHQHPRSSAERGVIDAAMDIARVLAHIMAAQVENLGGPRLTKQAGRAELVDHVGKDAEHIDPHSGSASTSRPGTPGWPSSLSSSKRPTGGSISIRPS
jgi:hypothetical protein